MLAHEDGVNALNSRQVFFPALRICASRPTRTQQRPGKRTPGAMRKLRRTRLLARKAGEKRRRDDQMPWEAFSNPWWPWLGSWLHRHSFGLHCGIRYRRNGAGKEPALADPFHHSLRNWRCIRHHRRSRSHRVIRFDELILGAAMYGTNPGTKVIG